MDRVLKAIKVRKVQLEPQVQRVTVVRKVQGASKVHRVPLEPKAHAVHAESKVLKVSKVYKATGEIQDRRVNVVGPETGVI